MLWLHRILFLFFFFELLTKPIKSLILIVLTIVASVRYEDDLPCLKLKSSCPKTAVQFTEDKTEEPETDDEVFDDDFFDFKRKKRSVEGEELPSPQGQIDLNDADFEAWEKGDKAGFEDCTCKWGLFRDRNVTLRKPVMFIIIIIFNT